MTLIAIPIPDMVMRVFENVGSNSFGFPSMANG